jgi:RNA polymerase sigma factor (sigma-70 family)
VQRPISGSIFSVAETQKHAEFPATKWSVIIRATAVSSPISRDALEDLCRLYWPPLYAFLRRSGHTPHEAQDLVQGYLARLLEREDLATVSSDKGRFRSYLLAGLRNFLVSEARQAGTLKRGGRAEIISLDIENAEALCRTSLMDAATPDLAFDRRWAETILDQALEKLRQENVERGKEKFYETLKPCLATDTADNYASLGRELSMTPGAIAVAIHRLRLRFRELVRSAVADTVGSEADLEEEMRNFLAILSP